MAYMVQSDLALRTDAARRRLPLAKTTFPDYVAYTPMILFLGQEKGTRLEQLQFQDFTSKLLSLEC